MMMNVYQKFIAISRYARFIEEEQRRETWEESVDRYVNYFAKKLPKAEKQLRQYSVFMKDLEVVPSMRAIMSAGPALDRDNIAGYNCSYMTVDDPKAFDECLYVLMCGTGVGFSVERKCVEKLPDIPECLNETEEVFVVEDSKLGWAKGLRKLISRLYAGEIPKWDLSKIRPAGARLKTFGGRASGPQPLENLFRFTVNTFKKAAGRKLTSIEAHDVMCAVAAAVVVGGVRRSAMISLSDMVDDRMRNCKMGDWWTENVNRSYANNSIAYNRKPEMGGFIKEWSALYSSKSGERGVFNRQAAREQSKKTGRRKHDYYFGTNPCGEIILRPSQCCNLSEIIIKPKDDLETLKIKAEVASFLGTIQSTLTDIRYLRPIWKKNMEEERLLGVSMTGILDNELLADVDKVTNTDILNQLKEIVIDTNKKWAKILGVNQSTATTCVKPSGTVSQLADCASGIHPRYSDYYIRRVRTDTKDPLADWMIKEGVPYEKDSYNPHNYVFAFPIQSPTHSKKKEQLNAIDQLKLWKAYREKWCEHNPSITVYVGEEEWMEVGAYVYEHFDDICGVSFLPKEDDSHSYVQAPYEKINNLQFKKLSDTMPTIDFSKYREVKDMTTSSQELACTGNSCEL
tara:strand:- start:196 stop:2076 length:1881 start_codon:yes stop_codon:yes gene_type:complete